MRRLLVTLSMVVGITAGMSGPVSAATEAPINERNCVGVILSTNTPGDFHHGEEAERAVAQAQDGGRGGEITAFTSFWAGCEGL